MCSSEEEPHALGVGNQSKHSCCYTDLFVCACAHIHMHVVCIRLCRCANLVQIKTTEEDGGHVWVFGKTLMSTIWTTVQTREEQGALC